MLREVIALSEGPSAVALLDEALDLGRRVRGGDAGAADRLAELAAELDLPRTEVLVRALTRWFQLINLAEDSERVRRLAERDARSSELPRAGSLRETIGAMAQAGVDADTLAELLTHARLRLVMTAHPTEARRRTTIDKLARIFGVLRELDGGAHPDHADARRRLLATIEELWGSDDIRAAERTVLDEVRAGLIHFASTLADTVPRIYRDLQEALAEHYPDAPATDVPPLLMFGSWIGGDRDGNPFVTPATTVRALELMRAQCLRLYDTQLEQIAGRLSLSRRLTGPAEALAPILSAGERDFPGLARTLAVINPEEPYRRALSFVRERVRAARETTPELDPALGYPGPEPLLADLHRIRRSLRGGSGALTADGDLTDFIRRVEVFGFHYARLDIREHAKVHRAALQEIYADLGVCDDYGALPEGGRLRLLADQIADRRPLIPADTSRFSASTRETLETFRMLRKALADRHRGAVRTYIVSGTEGPSDLLEVLLLAKEMGLCRAGGGGCALRIVPLFEAGETLSAAPETTETLMGIAVYRAALRAVGNEQEVMIGYSDSNKDVGYLASAWLAYRAQVEVSEVLRRHGVGWLFFHGRGGAVGRGGGPTNRAILALPPDTVGGRLKMTEQGEVLTAKYAVPEIAHRELELATSATLSTGRARRHARSAEFEALLAEMAAASEAVYRELVHEDPDFVRFFEGVTPLAEISRLRLGSRPAKRSQTAGIGDLRAIPWVFSWTQSRIVLPAWLGLGTALRDARERHGLELLREMAAEWPFFTGMLSNAEMGCAKADLGIAARYVARWQDPARDRIWTALREEFELTVAELVAIGGGERLLDSEPVLQASIDRRNPAVDPLSFIQIELLGRLQEHGEDGVETEELHRISQLTINGIASGLRNTG